MKTRIVVLITDMEQPLGRAIGNALEIRECVEFLQGRTPEDLETVSLALAAHMIRLGGRAKSIQQAFRMAYEAVSSGAAADRFRQIIQAQGGDAMVVNRPDLLPKSSFLATFNSPRDGYVSRCDAKLLGLASNALGAGGTVWTMSSIRGSGCTLNERWVIASIVVTSSVPSILMRRGDCNTRCRSSNRLSRSTRGAQAHARSFMRYSKAEQ